MDLTKLREVFQDGAGALQEQVKGKMRRKGKNKGPDIKRPLNDGRKTVRESLGRLIEEARERIKRA